MIVDYINVELAIDNKIIENVTQFKLQGFGLTTT